MAGVQVVRFKSRPKLEGQLVAHVAGETRPETARPVEPVTVQLERHPPVTLREVWKLGGEGYAAGAAAVRKHWPTGRGRKPHEVLGVMIAGPPPYGDPDEWSPEREFEWALASHRWMLKAFGPDVVEVTSAFHRDESSPHVQSMVIPIHKGKLAWKAVRDAAAKRARAAGVQPTGRTAYGTLQDWYHEEVGRRFGLERGEVGSQAKHQAVDRAKAAERRVEVAKAREQEADDERTRIVREKDREFVMLDRVREARAEEERPHVAQAVELVMAVQALSARHHRLRDDLAADEDARRVAQSEATRAQRLADRARRVIRRFFAAAERTIARFRSELGDLARRRLELTQQLAAAQEQGRKAAEAAQAAHEEAARSREEADRAIEANRLRIAESRAAADQAVAADQERTSKAKGDRAAAEAAAKTACASRDSAQEVLETLNERISEAQAQIADDRALGASLVSRHGRGIREGLEGERDDAVRRAETAEAGRTAEKARADQAQDLAFQWQRYAEGQRDRADQTDARVEELERELHVTSIVREAVDQDGGVSEAERVRRRRAEARESAPPPVSGAAPSVGSPDRAPSRRV